MGTASPPAGGSGEPLVLVVDDDDAVRAVVARGLTRAGFAVIEASHGDAVERLVAERAPAVVVLDVEMPERDGLTVLRDLRRRSAVPVILLTGRAGELDRILGLELGADDYVVKPFSARELALRVGNVLRRPAGSAGGRDDVEGPDGPGGPEGPGASRFGDLVVDTAAREVWVEGRPVALTAREFDLLAFLVRHPRRVFNRQQLLAEVWRARSPWQDPDTVTEHVRRLRAKIEPDPAVPRWIVTVRGAGYRFQPPREAR